MKRSQRKLHKIIWLILAPLILGLLLWSTQISPKPQNDKLPAGAVEAK